MAVQLYFLYDFNENEAAQAKTQVFFDEVTGAARAARVAANLPENTWDWAWIINDEGLKNLQQHFNVPFKYPSVVVNYGEKWVYLKNKGNPNQWQKVFELIFKDAQLEQNDGKEGNGDRDQSGKGKAESGNGSGNWGLPMRPCIPIIDDTLNSLLTSLGIDVEKYKKYVLLGGAAVCGFFAFKSEQRFGQVGFGASAAALAYLALAPIDPNKPCK